jgi:hypothetical protein
MGTGIMVTGHDAHQCVSQLRQTLAADKLPIGFFLGAGCPCSIMVEDEKDSDLTPIIPDIRGLTSFIDGVLSADEDEVETPNVELMLKG